jgi:hypothetical protein
MNVFNPRMRRYDMEAFDMQPKEIEKAIEYCHLKSKLGDFSNLKPVNPTKFLAYSIILFIITLGWLAMVILIIAPSGRYSPAHTYIIIFPGSLAGYFLIQYQKCKKIKGYVPSSEEIKTTEMLLNDLEHTDPRMVAKNGLVY